MAKVNRPHKSRTLVRPEFYDVSKVEDKNMLAHIAKRNSPT